MGRYHSQSLPAWKPCTPGSPPSTPRTPVDAVQKAWGSDERAVFGGLGVAPVPVESVDVSDALAEVADGAAGCVFVEEADAVLTGPVEVSQPAP